MALQATLARCRTFGLLEQLRPQCGQPMAGRCARDVGQREGGRGSVLGQIGRAGEDHRHAQQLGADLTDHNHGPLLLEQSILPDSLGQMLAKPSKFGRLGADERKVIIGLIVQS